MELGQASPSLVVQHMRRKISKQAAYALRNGETFKQGNTVVDGVAMYVHGSCIAARMPHGVQFSMAGWATKLTRERLNAVFDVLGIKGQVHQSKGEQVLSLNGRDIVLDAHEVYLIDEQFEVAPYFDVIPI
ncbi:MAG: hypothetical protein ACO3O3_11500 [Ilumatobacteraceae bacterium]